MLAGRRPKRPGSAALVVVGCALLLARGAAAQGQGNEPLTVSQAARLALETYPAVAAAEAQAQAARRRGEGIAATRLPGVGLEASATRFQEPMLVAPLHEFDPAAPPRFDETLLQASVRGGYTLFDGGARAARVTAARNRAEAAGAVTAAAELEVLRAVTWQFAQVTAARAALGAHDMRLQALEEELKRSERLLAAGRAPQLQVLRAEAALAAAGTERVRSLTQLEVAVLELGRLIGAGPDPISIGEVRPLRWVGAAGADRTEVIARALSANPEIARLGRESRAAGAEERLARSAYLPEVRLFGQYDQRGSAHESFTGEWSVGAAVSVRLFDGGARRHESARAAAQRTAAERQLELGRLRVEAQVDGALAALREAEAQMAGLSTAVAQFEEVVRGERLALEAGAGVQTDYLAALADLLGARAQLAQAAVNRIAAHTELASVTGQLSVAWLERNLESEQ